MIVFGTHEYGRCDHVPGLFCVKTRFLHFDFIPLIPTRSYLILEPNHGPYPIGIPLCLRSILIVWTRLLLAILAFFLAVLWLAICLACFGGEGFRPGPNPLLTPTDATAILIPSTFVAICLYRQTFRWSAAGRPRAYHLGKLAGIPPEVVADAIGDDESR